MATIGKKSGKGDILYIRWKETSAAGKRIQRYQSTGTTDPEIAQQHLVEFEERRELQRLAAKFNYRLVPMDPDKPQASPGPVDGRPIEDLVEEWAETRKGETSPKQIAETKRKVLRAINETGMQSLGDFTPVRIRRFLDRLRKQTTSKKYNRKEAEPATLQTKNLYQMAIKSFDIWLCQMGYLPKRRLKELKKLKFDQDGNRPAPSRRRDPLTMDQVRQLWDATRKSKAVVEGFDGQTRHRLYVLASVTGYRRRELGSLTRESFHLDDEYPEVAVSGEGTKNSMPSHQPIPIYLVPTLRSWLLDYGPAELLFPNLANRKTATMMYRDLVEANLQEPNASGSPIMDFHGWRHLYVTNCWTSGASPDVVRRMARHADQRTTQGYTHVRDEQRHDAANKMNRLPVLDETGDYS